MITREDCHDLDRRDPLAPHRELFDLPPDIIYMDGNSLGALPRETPERVRRVVEQEWGERLIRSWNEGWMELPRQVGAKIAKLVGAEEDEVICSDSTSVNLFKALAAALRIQMRHAPDGARRVILSERGNFPTDLYIAGGVIDLMGGGARLEVVEPDELESAIGHDTAVLMLTHVNFRTGAMHDMASLTARAREAGALTVWDLSHSAGAVPVDLGAAGADFAVGCGYKYLNGGPGAPAFLYAATRHLATSADDAFAHPLSGWLGHRAPFEFAAHYAPAAGIDRFMVGTPAILSLAALETGVDTVLAAGIPALRGKSIALTDLFIGLVRDRCAGTPLTLASPADPGKRGSQVCFSHPRGGEVMTALIGRGVIGDFRPPDILRFGFAPLYLRYVDVYDAVEILRAEAHA